MHAKSMHSKLEIILATYLPAYIWFLTIIAVTENTLDAEINAPSNTGTILSDPNNDECHTFICMAASNNFVQFELYFNLYIKSFTNFFRKKRKIFGIKLDAEISIWMQSGLDGFAFSATLLTPHIVLTATSATSFTGP